MIQTIYIYVHNGELSQKWKWNDMRLRHNTSCSNEFHYKCLNKNTHLQLILHISSLYIDINISDNPR